MSILSTPLINIAILFQGSFDVDGHGQMQLGFHNVAATTSTIDIEVPATAAMVDIEVPAISSLPTRVDIEVPAMADIQPVIDLEVPAVAAVSPVIDLEENIYLE